MEVTVRSRVGRPTDIVNADEGAQTQSTHSFDNVANVEYRYNGDDDDWPTVRLTLDDDSTEEFEYATVNLDDTEPEVTATMVRDSTPSIEYQEVTTHECYGVWRESYEDSFGRTRHSHCLFIERDDEPVVLSPHNYRGIDVRYPNGERDVYGSLNRHSNTAQGFLADNEPYNPPHQNEEGVLTLNTTQGELYDVENVRRVQHDLGDDFKFDVTTSSNTIRVDDINDAEGPCYAACVKHQPTVGGGTTVTSIQRAIGLYLDEAKDGEYTLTALGFPTSAGIYRPPQTHSIAALGDIESLHIKLPNGTVQSPAVEELVLVE